ncbi:MAG: superoxide dismutase [Oligoflexia bacterium]|nr:superoxide dismutase [Oligoflexia bacterium]
MARFELAPLPYDYNALAPIVSAETLQYHHDKHHQAYVDKLNELLPGSGFEDAPLEDIIKKATGALFNQAGQHWNHDFYWKSMKPHAKHAPEGTLKSAIEKKWKTIEEFKAAFEKAAVGTFGSGWCWLVKDGQGDLQIVSTSNAENPMRQNLKPLFTCDVWEHAYYIDYRNARAKYVQKFWDVLNWEFVAANFGK